MFRRSQSSPRSRHHPLNDSGHSHGRNCRHNGGGLGGKRPEGNGNGGPLGGIPSWAREGMRLSDSPLFQDRPPRGEMGRFGNPMGGGSGYGPLYEGMGGGPGGNMFDRAPMRGHPLGTRLQSPFHRHGSGYFDEGLPEHPLGQQHRGGFGPEFVAPFMSGGLGGPPTGHRGHRDLGADGARFHGGSVVSGSRYSPEHLDRQPRRYHYQSPFVEDNYEDDLEEAQARREELRGLGISWGDLPARSFGEGDQGGGPRGGARHGRN